MFHLGANTISDLHLADLFCRISLEYEYTDQSFYEYVALAIIGLLSVFAISMSVIDKYKSRRYKNDLDLIISAMDDPFIALKKDGTVFALSDSAKRLKVVADNRITDPGLLSAAEKVRAGEAGGEVRYTCGSSIFRVTVQTADNGLYFIVLKDITDIENIISSNTEFISVLTHEMRTPLTVIKGFALNLDDENLSLTEEKKHSYYRSIASETDRLSYLVNNTLTINKLDSGTMHIQTEPLDLSYCLHEYRDRLQMLCSEKNIVCSVYAADDIIVDFDYNYLGQILEILCENAVKFTRDGGHITLGAVNADRIPDIVGNKVQIMSNNDFTADSSLVFVYVEDDGCGITKNILPHIFDKLFTTDSNRVTGSGLGLSIADSIIRSVGQTMIASSLAGKGSCIGFTLPLFTEDK